MKCLTLMQPYASAIFLDLKHYETRSWRTNHRGLLLIHAAKGFPAAAREFAANKGFHRFDLPLGSIIGVVVVEDCLRVYDAYARSIPGWMPPPPEPELSFGDYTSGRYAWRLTDPRLFREPVPYRGALGLWDVPDAVVREALATATGTCAAHDAPGGGGPR